MKYAIALLAGTLLDVLYVAYVRAVHAGSALKACLASVAIGACGVVGVTGVVHDQRTAVPYLLGLGCGTYLGMKWNSKG